MTAPPRHIGVIGSGVAGLTAAYVVSIVLLTVFGALFASADAAFARVFAAAIPYLRADVVASTYLAILQVCT